MFEGVNRFYYKNTDDNGNKLLEINYQSINGVISA